MPARGHTVQDGLSNRDLQIARQPCPGPPGINRQLRVLLPCSEPEKLFQETQAFLADASGGLEDQSAEKEVRIAKPGVVLPVLPRSAGISGTGRVQVHGAEGGRDRHVHSQALGVLPARQRDITWPSPRPVPRMPSSRAPKAY